MSKIDQKSKDWVYKNIICPVMESGSPGFWTYELHNHYPRTGLDAIYAEIYDYAQTHGIESARATLRSKDQSYAGV